MFVTVKISGRGGHCGAIAVAALILALASPDAARAEDTGCCQYYARNPAGATRSRGPRLCADMSRRECGLLRPMSTFLRGFQCDVLSQRCRLSPPSTPTPTPTFTPPATPTPTVEPVGCCQLDGVRGAPRMICGNAVSRMSCLNDFNGQPTFCAECVCSSHSEAGFAVVSGACVTRTPTPTATPADPRGCCQLDNVPGVRSSICGNAVHRSTCLDDFNDTPTFCADCACTSHSGAGFDLAPGACVKPGSPGRAPHKPHPPHQPGRR